MANDRIWAARGAPETVTVKDSKGNRTPIPKRAPINPRTGWPASNGNPAHWGTRAAAEKRAAEFPASGSRR